MATYAVDYFIKRDHKEREAHHITEASTAVEAIQKTKEFIEKHRLPYAFRPKARKLATLELSSVEWRDDSITRNFVEENTRELVEPSKMTPGRLADATTYCRTNMNPYAEELMRRAGNLEAFKASNDPAERGKILRSAAKAFGIMLF